MAALEDYEAAHRASDRNLSAHELEQIRHRLLDLSAQSAEDKKKPDGGGLWAGLEYAWLVSGALMLTADLMRGFVLTALFAFLCWIRRQDLGGS